MSLTFLVSSHDMSTWVGKLCKHIHMFAAWKIIWTMLNHACTTHSCLIRYTMLVEHVGCCLTDDPWRLSQHQLHRCPEASAATIPHLLHWKKASGGKFSNHISYHSHVLITINPRKSHIIPWKSDINPIWIPHESYEILNGHPMTSHPFLPKTNKKSASLPSTVQFLMAADLGDTAFQSSSYNFQELLLSMKWT